MSAPLKSCLITAQAPVPWLGLLKAAVVASVAFQSQLPAFLCPHSCTHEPSHEKSPLLEFGAHYRERGGGGEGFHGVKHSIFETQKRRPCLKWRETFFPFQEEVEML